MSIPEDLTLISLWVHVPLVTAWIGFVMLDLLAMLAPGLESRQRAGLILWSRPFVIVAIPLIIVTGVWQTIFNPLSVVTSIAALEALKETTTYGLALFWKHGFVLLTFAVTVYVRFMLAPRLAIGQTEPPLQRSVLWLSMLNAVACLGALVFATRMVWTLH